MSDISPHPSSLEPGVLVERPSWVRIAVPAVLLGVILLALYWPILRDLGRQWRDDANYQHGFLVPLLSAFLVWRRRAALSRITPRGTWLGLPVLLAGIGTLLVGDIGAENFLMRSSLLVILAGLILLHLGKQMFRGVLFPLAYLFFMIPLPAILLYAVTFPLQNVAARQAAWVLDFLGIPVLLDGNVIQLTQISLGVTEACSGIRSLISLIAGAVAWAYVMLPTGWVTVLFVACALPITVFANAGRVVATGLIGQWFGVEYASGFFHEFAGWVVYLFAFACLMGVHGLIQLARRRSAART